tara:strand:+ start:879 stop:995 length:117 start_codon:yes stop_codon:yes gene_type:complete
MPGELSVAYFLDFLAFDSPFLSFNPKNGFLDSDDFFGV